MAAYAYSWKAWSGCRWVPRLREVSLHVEGEQVLPCCTRLDAYPNQDGTLKAVVLRTYDQDTAKRLPVGAEGDLFTTVLFRDDKEPTAITYGRVRVSANFICGQGVDRFTEWAIAFKPVKE